MARYIELDALLAEIEKRRDAALMRQKNLKSIGQESVINEMVANELNKIISLIDTLEVKDLPIWEKVSPDTGQTTLYKDEGNSYLERFGYRIDLKDLDKLPKKNLKVISE